MRRANLPVLLACAAVVLVVGSCSENADAVSPQEADDSVIINTAKASVSVKSALAANQPDHELATDYIWNSAQVIAILLNGSSVTETSDSVLVDGTTATITAGGTYSIQGSLANGRIVVNATSSAIVRLILNGVTIGNTSTSPLSVTSAKKVIIVLADNTVNTLTDAASYVFPTAGDDEPNAALFSKCDLTICGNGSLIVTGNYNDAIASKDGLIIKSGTITVNAVDDGIRGKDYLVVKNGTVTVTATGDGLKSDNDEDATRGYISIESGAVHVTAGGDGLAAETDVIVANGDLAVMSGGGSGKTVTGDFSAKGIKGVVSVVIGDGSFALNSADDAIHSNASVVINGGSFAIATGDDGIHADSILGINGGTIVISKSYEGIESVALVITDGEIHVTASDDGINGAGGNDGSAVPGWGSAVPTTGNRYLSVSGGTIVVNASGDGVDVNGSIVMTGGTLIVNGPTSNGNGPLDYDATFKMTGGMVVAAGSSGMAQAPSATSSQYALLVTFTSTKPAGTLFHIQAADGTDILTFKPAKIYQSVAFCSPKLVKGSSYDVYLGGSSTGTVKDGLFEGGTYSGGTKSTSFTVSGIVTRTSG
jgi:hypothetical protein